MENMETNDIITTEAIDEIKEAIPTDKNGLNTAAKVGFIGAASIAAWEFVMKPIGRKVKGAIAKRKAAKAAKNPEVEDVDLDNLDTDIPEIDE